MRRVLSAPDPLEKIVDDIGSAYVNSVCPSAHQAGQTRPVKIEDL